MNKNKKKEPQILLWYLSTIVVSFAFYKLGRHLLSIEWTISGWLSLCCSVGGIWIIIRYHLTGRRGPAWDE